jgi:hypothetical protein
VSLLITELSLDGPDVDTAKAAVLLSAAAAAAAARAGRPRLS